jgi:mono/diheme cytochrome c family protein
LPYAIRSEGSVAAGGIGLWQPKFAEAESMKHRVIGVFLAGLFVVGLSGFCARSANAQSAGEALFKGKCAMCHGPDGKGEVPMGKKLGVPSLTSPDVQNQSEAQLTDAITKGKNKMPAYDGKLSKDQITTVVAYIRELGKKH